MRCSFCVSALEPTKRVACVSRSSGCGTWDGSPAQGLLEFSSAGSRKNCEERIVRSVVLQCPGAAEWRGLISRPIDRRLLYRTSCERTRVSARHGERFPGLRVVAKAGAL